MELHNRPLRDRLIHHAYVLEILRDLSLRRMGRHPRPVVVHSWFSITVDHMLQEGPFIWCVGFLVEGVLSLCRRLRRGRCA